MREILTTTADEAARATHFVQRTSPLGGAIFSPTLVLGFLGHPQAPLEAFTPTAATLGVSLTPQALAQRLTAAAAACLEQGLTAAISRVMAAEPVALPWLARLPAVSLQESSTMVLPDALAPVWQGCGGRTPSHPSAALTLQVPLALRTGCLAGLQLQDGRASERSAAAPDLPVGALRIAELGSWRVEAFQALQQQGRCWLSRLQTPTAVYDPGGHRQDRLELLAAQPPETVELPILLGEGHRLPARLCAVPVPADVAATRRQRLRAAARKKGRHVSARCLALAAWTLLVTTLPPARFTLHEALVLGRVRWHIALLLKLWKSHGHVDESWSTTPWRIRCEVSAKLLALLIQHWLLRVSCWAYPHRSLTTAAQTMQTHALPLARAFATVRRLGTALLTVKRCLAAGCRMNRRKKQPNTYQLLLEMTSP